MVEITYLRALGDDEALSDEARLAARARLVAEIARAQGSNRRHRRRFLVPIAISVATVAALVSVAPSVLNKQAHVNVLQDAAAAVSAGPVLHVIERRPLPSLTGGGGASASTIVNLATGSEVPAEQVTELWFDADTGLLRTRVTSGSVVVADQLDSPQKTVRAGGAVAPADGRPDVSPSLRVFTNGGYQEALRSGAAKLQGGDVINGRDVLWLNVPPSGRAPATNVAVDPHTYQPVAAQAVCPQCNPAPALELISTIEGVPFSPLNFSEPDSSSSMASPDPNQQIGDLAAADASSFLGLSPVWVGAEWNGLKLASIQGIRSAVESDRGLLLTYSIGSASSASSLTVAEATTAKLGFSGFSFSERGGQPAGILLGGIPAEGSALLVPGDGVWHLQFRRGGLLVEIDGPSKQLVLAAAAALRAM